MFSPLPLQSPSLSFVSSAASLYMHLCSVCQIEKELTVSSWISTLSIEVFASHTLICPIPGTFILLIIDRLFLPSQFPLLVTSGSLLVFLACNSRRRIAPRLFSGLCKLILARSLKAKISKPKNPEDIWLHARGLLFKWNDRNLGLKDFRLLLMNLSGSCL